MTNRTSKKAGKLSAYLKTTQLYLLIVASGPATELLVLIVLGGLLICL